MFPKSHNSAFLLVAFWWCTTLSPVSFASAFKVSCIYVSTSGSDANDGLSRNSAFLSLERARTAARASSTKTVCLTGGVYLRTAPLDLGGEDAGETWRASPDEIPILEGQGTVESAVRVTGNQITVQSLVIRNFHRIGIFAQNVSGAVIDGNSIEHISSDGWNQGGIVVIGKFRQGTITNNQITSVNYAGILIANGPTDNIDDLTVEHNVVLDTCISVADCGAIYLDDRSHTSHNITIDGNRIHGFGSAKLQSKGIYLDDQLSNSTVTNNIVDGSGTYALQIHGGDNNVISNNVFNITDVVALALYQYVGDKAANYGMKKNLFACNIVYSEGVSPDSLWVVSLQPQDSPPIVNNNLYWARISLGWKSKNLLDIDPTVADPKFVNSKEGDYRVLSKERLRGCGPTERSHK